MSILKILHVFTDDKFFDHISSVFDKIEGVNNLYVFFSKKKNYKFKYSQSYHKIQFVYDKKKYLSLFKDPSIGVVFYHSLPPSFYEYVLNTDENKINIWWAWGYDIYSTGIVDIKLYLPLTIDVKDKVDRLQFGKLKFYKSKIRCFIKDKFGFDLKVHKYRKVLPKINYVIPILPIEYELISQNRFFCGELLMERASFRDFDDSMIPETYPLSNGNILLGNSASFENNHLDIMKIFKTIDVMDRKIIMPLSYGNKLLAKILKSESDSKYLVLESFLPPPEYNEMLKSCSYAVFGSLRQHAIGNINLCLRYGIKVFLYKDGITYKQLIKDGYHVFTIDFHLNEHELSKPLLKEQIIHNQNIYKSIIQRNGLSALDRAIKNIKPFSNQI